MPIFVYECPKCQKEFELIILGTGPEKHECPTCLTWGKKVIVPGIGTRAPLDSPWIGDVRTVVDKNSGKPWCEEFMKHPSRANFNEWQKKEGLRHIEPGESPFPKEPTKREKEREETKMINHLASERRKINKLEVRG